MHVTSSERTYLNELMTKGVLTAHDILHCIAIWRLRSTDPTLQVGRWKTYGLPQGLYKLRMLALEDSPENILKTDTSSQSTYELQLLSQETLLNRPALNAELLLQVIAIGENQQLRAQRTIMPSTSDSVEIVSILVTAARTALHKLEEPLTHFLNNLQNKEQLTPTDVEQCINLLNNSGSGKGETTLAQMLKKMHFSSDEVRSGLHFHSLLQILEVGVQKGSFTSKTFTTLCDAIERIIKQRHDKAKDYLISLRQKTSLQYSDILQCIDLWHDRQNITDNEERRLIPAGEEHIEQLQGISIQKIQYTMPLNFLTLNQLIKINTTAVASHSTTATLFATDLITSLAHAAATMRQINGEKIKAFQMDLGKKKEVNYTDLKQSIVFLRYLNTNADNERVAVALENIPIPPEEIKSVLGMSVLDRIIEIHGQNATVSSTIFTKLAKLALTAKIYVNYPNATTILITLKSKNILYYSDILTCIDLWHNDASIPVRGVETNEDRIEKLQNLDISKDKSDKIVSLDVLRELYDICIMPPPTPATLHSVFATEILLALFRPVISMLHQHDKHEQKRIGAIAISILKIQSDFDAPAPKITDFPTVDQPKIQEYLNKQARIAPLAQQILRSSEYYPPKKITDFDRADQPMILEYMTTIDGYFLNFFTSQHRAISLHRYKPISTIMNSMVSAIVTLMVYGCCSHVNDARFGYIKSVGRIWSLSGNYLIMDGPTYSASNYEQHHLPLLIRNFKSSIITAYAHEKLPEMMDLMKGDTISINEKVQLLFAYRCDLLGGASELNTKMQQINKEYSRFKHGDAVSFFQQKLADGQEYQVKDKRTDTLITIFPDINYISWYLDKVLDLEYIPSYIPPDFCTSPMEYQTPLTKPKMRK